MNLGKKYILLTIDVEDWFQVENFKPWIQFDTWDQCELRVERNVHQLLNLFDSVTSAGKLEARDQETKIINSEQRNNYTEQSEAANGKPFSLPDSKPSSQSRPKATFFVLGWLAERLPNLVREIQSRGHEVASHGYNHTLCNEQSSAELKKELTDSKKLLEDITRSSVSGFRAPNFSINDRTLKIVEDCGYIYDSSYNSFGLHGRYGKISSNANSKNSIAHKISKNFFELPISNIHFSYPLSFESSALSSRKRFVLPWGGGGYFRLLPYRFFRCGVETILKKDGTYLFYIHPWELDPEQPRVKEISCHYKLRHYNNIKRTYLKLSKLINDFEQCKFITCSQYLASELDKL